MFSRPSDEDFTKEAATPATASTKRISPQSLVNSIYELKQTVYDLARYVCSGGKSDRSAVAVSGGIRLRVIGAGAGGENPRDFLQELQSRVQDLLHKIELKARMIEGTDATATDHLALSAHI